MLMHAGPWLHPDCTDKCQGARGSGGPGEAKAYLLLDNLKNTIFIKESSKNHKFLGALMYSFLHCDVGARQIFFLQKSKNLLVLQRNYSALLLIKVDIIVCLRDWAGGTCQGARMRVDTALPEAVATTEFALAALDLIDRKSDRRVRGSCLRV